MTAARVLIKLGGSSLQDASTRNTVIETIRGFRDYGYSVAVVHGGGPAINKALTDKGISWKFINGQRQTTIEMMSVIEEVLAGDINKQLVDELKAAGIPALGFSGVERNTLFCEQADPELGQVGRICDVNADWLERMLESSNSFVPVIAPIGIGAGGEKYNINADWAAAKLAMALHVQKLIFLTDQKGILNPNGNLIEAADLSTLAGLIDSQVVTGGMYTKVLTVVEALKNGVTQVRVMNGKDSEFGLWSDRIGTLAYA